MAGLASRLLDIILLKIFGVGGVAFRTPYVGTGTYEWLKLTCEWLGDNGVTGVSVVWLICVSGVWLWLWLEWLWFRCIWWWFMYWTGGDIVLIGACSDKFKFIGFCRTQIVFSFCHTKTLWTIAHPQNTMPMPMRTLVIIAGVEWNCVNVYRIIPGSQVFFLLVQNYGIRTVCGFHLPVKNIGIDMKKPPTAHTLLTLDFWRYLFPLQYYR